MPNEMNYTYTKKPDLVINPNPITDNVIPKAGVVYKRGDLLVVGADNVATHAVKANNMADWHVICNADLDADQVTKHLAKSKEFAVYVAGKFDVDLVTLKGVELTDAEKLKARAYSTKSLSIQLSKTEGIK